MRSFAGAADGSRRQSRSRLTTAEPPDGRGGGVSAGRTVPYPARRARYTAVKNGPIRSTAAIAIVTTVPAVLSPPVQC
jgi:hypothetical protein